MGCRLRKDGSSYLHILRRSVVHLHHRYAHVYTCGTLIPTYMISKRGNGCAIRDGCLVNHVTHVCMFVAQVHTCTLLVSVNAHTPRVPHETTEFAAWWRTGLNLIVKTRYWPRDVIQKLNIAEILTGVYAWIERFLFHCCWKSQNYARQYSSTRKTVFSCIKHLMGPAILHSHKNPLAKIVWKTKISHGKSFTSGPRTFRCVASGKQKWILYPDAKRDKLTVVCVCQRITSATCSRVWINFGTAPKLDAVAKTRMRWNI